VDETFHIEMSNAVWLVLGFEIQNLHAGKVLHGHLLTLQRKSPSGGLGQVDQVAKVRREDRDIELFPFKEVLRD
jgi:hypothetical protein